ncbi:DNA methyltransferase [Saccharopolyspora sp. CA-218241]|uniref:DNA methyltransferase n=1 Tax=Saccharopolyspora sp. CA-218241 TaxID=3240027 RepID=UPI003D998CA7
MSNIGHVPEELSVGRGDPAYMAHAYLTKVPVPAITPFIEAYTQPGDVVLDPFAGSGMTGVAAAICGRRARQSDVSVLGQHIGRNYVNLVDPSLLHKHAEEVITATRESLQNIYAIPCAHCGQSSQLAKAVWSILVSCTGCGHSVNYYRSLESADWNKPSMRCPRCQTPVSSKNRRVGEEPVVDYVICECSTKQREQGATTSKSQIDLLGIEYPRVEITPDREMYKSSALGKNGLTTVDSFYSPRNLAVLGTLRQKIDTVPDERIRSKLLFAFTGCLTRASKRYQWSRKRPLNAANANYYVAPVFYEWNVFDLFERKVTSAARADEWINEKRNGGLFSAEADAIDVTYEIGSAEAINLPDDSIDYVFMDPPFGSNLFYADMALFQEGWLGHFTDAAQEAVVDRSRGTSRSSTRYERLLTNALHECKRVLRPHGRISMVFGNSSGKVWALVQRAVAAAGLRINPDELVILNKGQRSVKGLASGFEHVATLDLILTMTPSADAEEPRNSVSQSTVAAITQALAKSNWPTPSRLYLELLRHGIRNNWELDELDLRTVTDTLLQDGWSIEPKTGRLTR